MNHSLHPHEHPTGICISFEGEEQARLHSHCCHSLVTAVRLCVLGAPCQLPARFCPRNKLGDKRENPGTSPPELPTCRKSNRNLMGDKPPVDGGGEKGAPPQSGRLGGLASGGRGPRLGGLSADGPGRLGSALGRLRTGGDASVSSRGKSPVCVPPVCETPSLHLMAVGEVWIGTSACARRDCST